MRTYPDKFNALQNLTVAGIPRYLDIYDLSVLLGRAVSTIRNQLVAQADDPSLKLVPVPFRSRGSRLLRWHQSVVADFMEADSGRKVVLCGVDQPAMTLSPRKRGRPSKAEQIARREAFIGAPRIASFSPTEILPCQHEVVRPDDRELGIRPGNFDSRRSRRR